MTGTAILTEYAIAPAAIAVFIGGYCQSLFGWDGPLIYAASYLVFIGLHLRGVGEALKVMLVITAIAVLAERAGIPAGVFQVVTTSDAPSTGQEFCENPIVRKLTFTGSTGVGRILLAQASQQVMKCSMELGLSLIHI